MGTLYILDRNNNVLAYNHPGNEDYYAYDDKTGKYILGEDDPNDPYEIMSFDDYKLLNTDKNILLEDKVREVLQTLNSVDNAYENEYYVLNYNNIDYVFYYDYAKLSETKLLYFFPLNQIYKPIYKIRNIIYLISIVIILFVSVISFWMSAFIIRPLKTLLNRALEVSNGNYKSSINTDKFYGEFFTLGKSFNFMTNTIDNYSENLENLVEKRNSELIKINKDLADVNDKMKSELVMAQNIQKAIIPKYFPSEDLIKVTGSYIPMEELGGDYYDVFKISQNKVGILIVDVSDHGVPAALITAMAKVSFIYYSTENRNTAQIVKLVNDELYKIIGNMEYLTAFFGIIDLKEGILEYTNAGHTDILILDDKLSFTYLQTNSFFIGLSDKADFISSFFKLAPRYKLFLYTDGLIEAKNGENELYSLERFKKVILNNQNLQIKDIKENIIEDMYNFKGNHFLDDDITLLIIQIAGKYDKINIEYQ